MAKIPFSKLNLKPNTEISNVSWIDDKGVETVFEVKHCLPIKEKMELVSNIVNQSIDDNGFYNPMRVKIFTCLEIVYAYTNLTFTAKQKEDIFKLYDLLTHNGLYLRIVQDIKDLKEINENVEQVIKNIYDYRNSVMGILENISIQYKDAEFDVNALTEKLLNPESLATLKEIAPLVQ